MASIMIGAARPGNITYRVVMSNDLQSLRDHGFVIRPRALDAATLEAARAYADALLAGVAWSDNDFDGRRTRRVHSLLGRLGALTPLVLHPAVRALVAAQIGAGHQLGMLFLSAVDPDQGSQMLHYDAGAYPVPRDVEVETNAIWALDDFTADNGATRVAPGSHTWPKGRRPEPGEMVPAVMPAGSVLVYSGRLWHAAGHNRSDATRRALISESVVPWLRPADNHPLDLGRDGLAALSPELLDLSGLGTHSKYFGFVGGRPALDWLTDRD